jgi:electron transfer flavoprotein alpha subunit
VAAKVAEELPEAFILGATIRGRELAARVAGMRECALISEVNWISLGDGVIETERNMYGGAAVLSEGTKGFAVFTVAPGKYRACKDEAHTGRIIEVQVETDRRIRQIKIEPIIREGVDISKAARIVGVGMGFDKKEDLVLAQNLAQALDAEIASTRPITEDRKWLPPETYVGISGAVIKPELYIGLGVSGQIQHIYGIRDAKIIVGININDKAPIFHAADYAILGDLYEIAPLLAEEVKKAG